MKKIEQVNDWEIRESFYGYVSPISLQVGNLVKGASFTYDKKEKKSSNTIDEAFRNLTDAGIVLKYDHIQKSFEDAVEVSRVKFEKAARAKLRQKYMDSWMIRAQPASDEINEKLGQNTLEVSFMSLDDWMKSSYPQQRVSATYRDMGANITINHNRNYSYYDDEGKIRQSAKLINVLKGFVRYVDKRITEKAVLTENAKNSADAHEKTRKGIVKTFGFPVEIEKVSKFSNYGPRNKRHYKVYKYNLYVRKRKITVSEVTYGDHKGKWDIGSFANLTLKEAKQVLAIFDK